MIILPGRGQVEFARRQRDLRRANLDALRRPVPDRTDDEDLAGEITAEVEVSGG